VLYMQQVKIPGPCRDDDEGGLACAKLIMRSKQASIFVVGHAKHCSYLCPLIAWSLFLLVVAKYAFDSFEYRYC
jgi:hypothetical protein